MVGVAPFRLIEHLAHHDGGVLDDAGGHPFAPGGRRRRCGAAGVGCEHVVGAAGDGAEVVDGSYLGEPFAVAPVYCHGHGPGPEGGPSPSQVGLRLRLKQNARLSRSFFDPPVLGRALKLGLEPGGCLDV